MAYRNTIIENMRKKYSEGTRASNSFRIDKGIAKEFRKRIPRTKQIGVVVEDMFLEFIAIKNGKLKR